MYNETYNEYIRSILGYPTRNLFEQYGQQESQQYQDYTEYQNPTFNTNINISGNTVELENSYPEIYKIVYPMISKKCENMNESRITKDDIENMTDEIYNAIDFKNKRQINEGMRDLIKILLIRELLNRRKPPFRPPMPNPPGPGPHPPRPPFRY